MAAPRLTRRALLRLLLLAGIGGGLAIAERRTQPVGLRTFLSWTLRGWRRRIEPPAVVALGASLSYDEALLRDAVAELWSQAEMPEVSGKRVLVKPNPSNGSKDAPWSPRRKWWGLLSISCAPEGLPKSSSGKARGSDGMQNPWWSRAA